MLEKITKLKKAGDLGGDLPLIVLADAVLFPELTIPLAIGDARSLRALDAAVKNNRTVIFSSLKRGRVDSAKEGDVFKVGVLAKLQEVAKERDG
ncbi:MAG: LON peptidase substrate-binding domain-containing protein, partial [Patescibacteria group bacterium]